ncbi:hypothetical protein IQ06DRAFT_364546 [Phaeosphaeriaceae sp. SRC1lsM3a]|nr:hypothetical protein IQ06DRAFT_364546 [Stagonospora sp. SRC1lsM3a]
MPERVLYAPYYDPCSKHTRQSIRSRAEPTMNSAADQLRPLKRQKTVLACHNCRAREVRCSGQRPRCSTCITRRETSTCAYDDIALAVDVSDNSTQNSVAHHNVIPSANGNASQSDASPHAQGPQDEVRPPRHSQPVDWNGSTIATTRNPWSAPSLWTALMNEASPAQGSQRIEARSVSESLLPQGDLGLSHSGRFLKAFVDATSEEIQAPARHVRELRL